MTWPWYLRQVRVISLSFDFRNPMLVKLLDVPRDIQIRAHYASMSKITIKRMGQ